MHSSPHDYPAKVLEVSTALRWTRYYPVGRLFRKMNEGIYLLRLQHRSLLCSISYPMRQSEPGTLLRGALFVTLTLVCAKRDVLGRASGTNKNTVSTVDRSPPENNTLSHF